MRVVGFDVGKTAGFAELELDGDARSGRSAHWIWGMTIPAEEVTSDKISNLVRTADLVAIEQIAGYPHGKENYARAKALLEAAKIGQTIVVYARDFWARRVVEMTAGRARSLVVGRNNPSDATIKIAVQRLIRGVPTRTNAHVRDAALVALACGCSAR